MRSPLRHERGKPPSSRYILGCADAAVAGLVLCSCGIPWLEHLTCDTCRVRYALADLSQTRTGDPGATAWNILLPVVVIFGGLMLLASMIPYS
jgi:hypothetical protein